MRESAARFGIREEAEALQAPKAPFGDKFPKTASFRTLETRVWWWRFTAKDERQKWSRVFPPPEGAPKDYQAVQRDNFKDLLELSAFFYELRARYDGRYAYEFGVPWINCTWWQKWALRSLVIDTFPDQYFRPVPSGKNEWVNLQLPVNLLSTDRAAKTRLVAELKRLRKERGIKAGLIRTRDLPWMSIETMDLEHYKITEKIPPGGLSAMYKQRQKYETQCKQLGIDP